MQTVALHYQTQTYLDQKSDYKLYQSANFNSRTHSSFCQVTSNTFPSSHFSDDTSFFHKSLFQFGPPHVLDWAFNLIKDQNRTIMKSASVGFAEGGHLEFLESLHKLNKLLPFFNLHNFAASGGHLHIIEWLIKNDYCPEDPELDCFSDICDEAAKKGHLNIIQWVYNKSSFTVWIAFYEAAAGGHFGILNWLVSMGYEAESDHNMYAAKGGWKVLEWFQSKGVELHEDASKGAAEAGRLDILIYLKEKGIPWSEDVCALAAFGGHLDLLKYLYKNGCKIEWNACSLAAEGGHLEILKWLRENQCKWNERTTYCASAYGQLDILKWALENGCMCNFDACAVVAALEGHFKVVKYFIENKLEAIDIYDVMMHAAKKGHLDILIYIQEKGFKFSETTIEWASKNGDLDMVKYLAQNGCKLTWGVVEEAIKGNQLEVLKWLEEQGCNVWDNKPL